MAHVLCGIVSILEQSKDKSSHPSIYKMPRETLIMLLVPSPQSLFKRQNFQNFQAELPSILHSQGIPLESCAISLV